MTTAALDPIRIAPIELWRIARRFIIVLHALFGSPSEVAQRQYISKRAHALMVSWLRCAEAMIRRLLLIEARVYGQPNTRPLLREKRKRVRRGLLFDPLKPETWRVSFRCFSPTPRHPRTKSGGDAEGSGAGPVSVRPDAEPVFVYHEDRAPRAKPSLRLASKGPKRPRRKPILRQDRLWVQHQEPETIRFTRPLAQRFEALIRVFNDPTAYARRVAQRLHATPHRKADLLHAPPEARHRVDRWNEFADAGPLEPPPASDSS